MIEAALAVSGRYNISVSDALCVLKELRCEDRDCDAIRRNPEHVIGLSGGWAYWGGGDCVVVHLRGRLTYYSGVCSLAVAKTLAQSQAWNKSR